MVLKFPAVVVDCLVFFGGSISFCLMRFDALWQVYRQTIITNPWRIDHFALCVAVTSVTLTFLVLKSALLEKSYSSNLLIRERSVYISPSLHFFPLLY